MRLFFMSHTESAFYYYVINNKIMAKGIKRRVTIDIVFELSLQYGKERPNSRSKTPHTEGTRHYA